MHDHPPSVCNDCGLSLGPTGRTGSTATCPGCEARRLAALLVGGPRGRNRSAPRN